MANPMYHLSTPLKIQSFFPGGGWKVKKKANHVILECLLSYFVTIQSQEKDNSLLDLKEAFQSYDTNIILWFTDPSIGKSKLYLRSAYKSTYLKLEKENSNPSGWGNYLKIINTAKSTESAQIAVDFHMDLNRPCSIYGMLFRKQKCDYQNIANEILIKHYNFTPKFLSRKEIWLYEGAQTPKRKPLDAYYSDVKPILNDIIPWRVFYCNKRKLVSSEYLQWIQIGYDEASWICICVSYVGITVYFYFYIFWTGRINKVSHTLSWLTGIALLFRQDHTPTSRKIVLLIAFTGWLLSVCYECFVKSEEAAPFDPQPFNNFTELLQKGYKFDYYNDKYFQFPLHMKPIWTLLEKHNFTFESVGPVMYLKVINYETRHNVSLLSDFYDEQKLFKTIVEREYKYLSFGKFQCHLLPEEFKSWMVYWTFRSRFQNLLRNSFLKLIEGGFIQMFSDFSHYTEHRIWIQVADREDYLNSLPLKMQFFGRIYSVFVICGILMCVCWLVFIVHICAIKIRNNYVTYRIMYIKFKYLSRRNNNSTITYLVQSVSTNLDNLT
jgi:hypothetical protein